MRGGYVVKYRDLRDADFRTVTMAGDEARRGSVERLYPEYVWDPDRSILANWVQAVSDANGVDYATGRTVVNQMRDPIYGGSEAAAVGSFVWYLA